MAAIDRFQFGVKNETVYGTPVTVDRFFETAGRTTLRPVMGVIESRGLRRNARVERNATRVRYRQGGAGMVPIEVQNKAFGFWLKHMLGTVATSGPVDSLYTHTATVGDLRGDSFTAQDNTPNFEGTSDYAITYEGCKVTKWKVANKVGEILLAELELDAEDWKDNTALASASYPAGVEPLSFVGGFVEINDVAYAVTECEVSVDNGLNTDRKYLRSYALKKEPVENAHRKIAWSVTGDFEDLSMLQRYTATVLADAVEKIELEWRGFLQVGAGSFAGLKITLDAGAFDEFDWAAKGPEAPAQKFGGKGLLGTDAIKIEYFTTDATP